MSSYDKLDMCCNLTLTRVHNRSVLRHSFVGGGSEENTMHRLSLHSSGQTVRKKAKLTINAHCEANPNPNPKQLEENKQK